MEKHLQSWGSKKEQCLDGEALNEISKVVALQDDQLRFQSSKFFIDPKSIWIKFRRMSRVKLAEVFISSWHPIVELGQLTSQGLKIASEYWDRLLPIRERLKRLNIGKPNMAQKIDIERLDKIRVISKEDFSIKLEGLWNELQERHSSEGELEYWQFIFNNEFPTTIDRAYCLSFLITHGYVKLVRKGKKLLLIPHDKQKIENRKGISFPISISKKDWDKWESLRTGASTARN